MELNVVFMGTPDFGVPSLQALANHFHVVGVITQPDRPAGRGRKPTPPAIKSEAKALGIPTYQPQSLHKPAVMDQLNLWNPELMVVAAYGHILPPAVLDFPPYGCLNVHASLLPRWRGAAPINAAILHGDQETGVTIMKMDEGMDSGPILAQEPIPIEKDDTAGSLFDTLSHLGAQLLVETIPLYIEGEITPQPQDDSKATYAPMLQREDGELSFDRSAEYLARQVRAYDPWPGTFTFWKGQRLIIHQAHAKPVTSPGIGVFCTDEGKPAIGTGQGILVLDEVQPAGKRNMAGEDFLRGAKDWGS
ncbi:MAG: methionyl-tRNA formyltransferase [Anaerolineales bacterium]